MSNNLILPATGAGTATPTVETIDIGGGVQRQVVTIGPRGGGTTDTFPSALSPASGLRVGGTTTNPSSVLTRPADTAIYAQNDLIASSTTAGSVVVPSFTATPTSLGSGSIRSCRLYSNKTSAWGGGSFLIEFWTAAPTFTNGDNGVYTVATGAASWLGSMAVTFTQVADGCYGAGVSNVGSTMDFALASGSSIFWTLKITSAAALTPASGQTFTLVPEIFQD